MVASLLGAWLVAQLPADYFVGEHRQHPDRSHWSIRLVATVVKNLVGIMLLIAGFIMLFTPGQGVLTILAGLLLTNFPGKYRLERRLAGRPAVLKTLNWLRARRGQPPFDDPD